MPKLKMHGGYTLDRGAGIATYWTCEHTALCGPEPDEPPMDCPKCDAMSETELLAFIQTKGVVIAPLEDGV
jgi:hypothetical protein